ncbi:hypothetical protein DRW07_08085 [Alteromonas sediminis]|uniref:Lipoprotein n=1 Tax=Alteromonas sediminis TaxID=2259342 RepID=A0A3N5ZC96_9ALTE|nr:hypothetical protein [Alteromonas sediminis]RPJ67468.1 hypothetical protein DRW07_08085 [Alteromonas sediminis]
MKTRIVLFSAFLILLQACGGGSSGTDTPPPVQPPTPPNPNPPPAAETVSLTENGLQLHGELTALAGESVGFAITTDDQLEIESILWQQISGPNVTVLATHTQVIGFDTSEPGQYQFRVTATLNSDAQRQLNFSLDVADSNSVLANVRLDHSATELGRVSLRVDTTADKTIDRISWTRLHGPQVNDVQTQSDDGEAFDSTRPHSLFFNAPSVTSDSVISYQANVTFTDGSEASDTALVLIDNVTINQDGYFTNNDLYVSSHMIPYREESPYADSLKRCVYNNQFDTSCSFEDLPLLGMETTTPTVEDVLNRTLVSHPWMGQRFEEYLRQSEAGSDMLNLLRGTTAVVISYDIRPSFYWVVSGAIYLDANNFWRTPQERDTLNTRPDFRSNFGNDLQFGIFWRYVKNGQNYLNQAFPAASERGDKPFSGLEASLTWLMYHELGHANDYFPPRRWPTISTTTSPLSYFNDAQPDSTDMDGLYPLTSSELKSLANVSFGGETATAQQRNFVPLDIQGFYAPDRAPAYYAYFNEREDYATLFERFMMLYRLGIPADTGIIGTVNNPNAIVTWGARARITDPALFNRLRYTIERVYPEIDFDAVYPDLPATQIFPPNANWFALLDLESNTQNNMAGKSMQGSHSGLGFSGIPNLMLHHKHGDPRKLPMKP